MGLKTMFSYSIDCCEWVSSVCDVDVDVIICGDEFFLVVFAELEGFVVTFFVRGRPLDRLGVPSGKSTIVESFAVVREFVSDTF